MMSQTIAHSFEAQTLHQHLQDVMQKWKKKLLIVSMLPQPLAGAC